MYVAIMEFVLGPSVVKNHSILLFIVGSNAYGVAICHAMVDWNWVEGYRDDAPHSLAPAYGTAYGAPHRCLAIEITATAVRSRRFT